MNDRSQHWYGVGLSILLVLVLANALAAGLRTVSEYDMGWQLATGRWIVQHHAIPSTDVLSYTSAGSRWIYSPFAGVLFYLIYSGTGYSGLSVFCALACLLTVAYLVRRRDLASLVLAMCAITAIAARTGPRADLFTTVFLAVMLGELADYQRGEPIRLWLLPVIMLFWVNLHPGFIVGLAAVGAYLFLEACDLLFAARRDAARQRLRRAWPCLVSTAMITLLNPWGPKLYSASLTMAGVAGQQQGGGFQASAWNAEFLPVRLSSSLLLDLFHMRHPGNGFVCLLVIAIVGIGLALWRRQPGVAVIQAAALYFGLEHSRYIGLFCVATVVVCATLAGDAVAIGDPKRVDPSADLRGEPSPLRWPLIRIPLPLAVVFLCAVGSIALLRTVDLISNRTHVVFHTNSSFGVGEASWYPERAANFIRRERLPGNIFEEYALGGFAAWRLGPEYPDFIDGRFAAVLMQERRLAVSPPDSSPWQEAADQWNINVLLIAEGGMRANGWQHALDFCQSANWRPVYMDEVSLVLIRNTPGNRPWLDRLQTDCLTQPLVPPTSASRKQLYDFWLNAGGLLFQLHRDRESEAALQQAQALYTYDPNARMNLAQLYLRNEMLDKAEAEYAAVLKQIDSAQAWYDLGRIYQEQQRLELAETAFSSAAHMAGSPCIPYISLAKVELQLQRPEAALNALERAEQTSPYRQGAESIAPVLYANIADGRAEANRMLSNLPRAIDFEQESLRLNPDVAERWNKLANLLEATGQVEQARQARQRALSLQSASDQP